MLDLRVNSNGTRISFLSMVAGTPDSNIWVWDVEADHLCTFDLGSTGRVPSSVFWDSTEPKVIAGYLIYAIIRIKPPVYYLYIHIYICVCVCVIVCFYMFVNCEH